MDCSARRRRRRRRRRGGRRRRNELINNYNYVKQTKHVGLSSNAFGFYSEGIRFESPV
jgi:hypothetical protein